MREQLCAKSPQAWKDLGIELLGDENSDALDVLKNNNSDVMSCCSAMFQLWLKRQPTASWSQLIQALRQLQLYLLADQVESKLTAVPVLESDSGLLSVLQ